MEDRSKEGLDRARRHFGVLDVQLYTRCGCPHFRLAAHHPVNWPAMLASWRMVCACCRWRRFPFVVAASATWLRVRCSSQRPIAYGLVSSDPCVDLRASNHPPNASPIKNPATYRPPDFQALKIKRNRGCSPHPSAAVFAVSHSPWRYDTRESEWTCCCF